MAAAVARAPDIPSRAPTPPPSLTLNTSLHGSAAPVPNKHIPFCSPGGLPQYGLPSPPATPPDKTFLAQTQSALYSPDPHSKVSKVPPVYAINASTLAQALHHIATRPSPDPDQVFPWLHGLNPDNQLQLAFFSARRGCSHRAPRCLRGLTVVKAGGDLGTARLKGAVAPEELLVCSSEAYGDHVFQDIDPKTGFSVRNFQIQTCKMATVSDIVVYGDDTTPRHEVEHLAQVFAQAQLYLRADPDAAGEGRDEFNTFVVTDPFSAFESGHPDIVATDSSGTSTGAVLDFLAQERQEMCDLSKASEIACNVWLGPTPDPSIYCTSNPAAAEEPQFDILVEASDFATIPDGLDLKDVEAHLGDESSGPTVAHLEFPSSGSFAASENGTQDEADIERLLLFCRWVHRLANDGFGPCGTASSPAHGRPLQEARITSSPDSQQQRPRRILIHCADGYTETSLLGLAYYMFAEGLPAHDAWIRMHRDAGRNFFAYPPDKHFLENVQLRLLEASPRFRASSGEASSGTATFETSAHSLSLKAPPPAPPMLIERPLWMQKLDGSLPSRVLPYLYLGNLSHAQNPELLKQLGITRVLSVGEPITWPADEVERDRRGGWAADDFMFVDGVQDNGVDPLTVEFGRCLQFIGTSTSPVLSQVFLHLSSGLNVHPFMR